MSWHHCEKCKTFKGVIARTSTRTGRPLKPHYCSDHTPPTAKCECCGFVTALSDSGRGIYDLTPSARTPWATLQTGNHQQVDDRKRGSVAIEKQINVCCDCASAFRAAYAVAFDTVFQQRGGKTS